jgi:putative ABC transport system substrate-binding protein
MRIGRTRLILALALGLFAWPLSADAQQLTRTPRVGVLSDVTPSLGTILDPVTDDLRSLGWVEGQNIAFERRYSEGNEEILPGLAAELVRLQPDVIFAIGTGAAWAAKNATQTIPVVFTRASDPIGSGLVASLARPGGNLTGQSVLTTETDAKWLELLTTAVPDAKRVGALWNPSFPAVGAEFKETERAARILNLELVPAEVRGPEDFEPAMRAMLEQHVGALIVVPASIFAQHGQRVIDLTAKARLPAIFFRTTDVRAGGLMSYGPNWPDTFRRASVYVDKILKGAKPADLPVEQPTKFELVINLNTAKALGLTIPYTLLGRADEVIE